MASRTWVAVSISLVIWFAYLKWFAPPTPTAGDRGKVTAQQGAGGEQKIEKTQPSSMVPFPVPDVVLPESAARTSGSLEIGFQKQGGRIGRVSVTNYRETIKPDSALITPVDSKQTPTNLGLYFSEGTLSAFGEGEYEQGEKNGNVVMSRVANGISVEKEFELGKGPYSFDATYRIKLPRGAKTDWGFAYVPLGGRGLTQDDNQPLQSWEVVALVSEKITRHVVNKIEETGSVTQGHVSWLAFGNRYFSTAAINKSAINPDVVFVNDKNFSGAYLRFPLIVKADQESLEFKFSFFVGPKDYGELSKISGLKQLIDYGMFSSLAYLMLEVLRFFYRFAHNYGVAIILLTVLVRALLYPLSLKSYRSMKAMQKLQPQLAALKEKHKEDPQRFNQEQLALFKTHKVNPMGGCLPMLVQLPVFIALYSLLGNSIELFHAPFFGWIHDLSVKDPYYVFPVLMGLAMLAQQRLTPTPGMDPMQAKMMYLMPIIFTAMMLNLPSGLTIYIFLSTLLGVAQQLAMNREPGSGSVKLATAPGTSSK